MKKTIIFLFVLTLKFGLFGQYDIIGDYKISGKVGIGTTTVGNAKLTVNSNYVNTFRLENNAYGGEPSIRFRARSSNGSKYLHADIAAVATSNSASDVGFLGFKVPYNNSFGSGYKMIINNNGQVGIGTTTPDATLTVAGDIHAQKVRVTVNAGADFVFKENYQLPSLEETETFVREHQHLPGIPSEKEMQEEGLELAEMNIRLLQKVEELTLYTIQQEKEIQALKGQRERMEQLEKENGTLKFLIEKVNQLQSELEEIKSKN